MATVGQSGAVRRITVHYANSPTRSGTGGAHLDGLHDDDLLQYWLGDVLQDQEGLYQSFLEEAYSNQNHMRGAGPSAPSDHSQPQHYHGESSTAAAATASTSSGTHEQIASDFQFAKELQEKLNIEDDDDDMSCVPSPSDSDDEHDHHEEEEEEVEEEEENRQDGDNDDDPDNMTYEQRQALVEAVGTEDRGLSDELISYLQPWKYKSSGFFSKKTNHEDCPICLSTYKNYMITLPCKHNYHAGCIRTWLKVNKICPVCKYEVFGPS